MSENCHNSGRIYWNLLEKAISYKVQYHDGKPKYKWFIDQNELKHFCNVMESVITDYAKTYKKNEPTTNDLDPTKWKYGFMTSSGAQVGYSTSLTLNYILLNLILLNSKKLNESTKLCRNSWIYNVCSGSSDYSHPEHISSKFIELRKKIFNYKSYYDNNVTIKPLTKELIEDVRDYLKDIFECIETVHYRYP